MGVGGSEALSLQKGAGGKRFSHGEEGGGGGGVTKRNVLRYSFNM